MELFAEIYGVAVATTLLGKTKDEKIAAYLNDKNLNIIKAVKEIQPIVLDFALSEEAAMTKVRRIFDENKLL